MKETAAHLNYHPNVAAQSLIARRTYLIGLTFERPSGSYVLELQNGAIDRLADERYRLVVLPFRDVASRSVELGRLILRAGLDSVLLAPPACDDAVILDMLDAQRLPYARITPHHDLDRGIVVVMDERAAACDIAGNLLELGHRRFGIILGDPSHLACKARLAGYSEAFADAGIVLSDGDVTEGDFTYDSGYRAAKRLLAQGPAPTAILAQNDEMASGAIAAARDLGLSVPDDVSIAGFDDSEISRTSWPQVTTVNQPVRDMAWEATDLLIAALEARDLTQRRKKLRHRLVVRGSTGRPSFRS